jgi:mannose-1-phosphate guanylyltransferase/mannose-6-phosphate isomerase
MTNPITPVVLAGGAGTRLWPVSRDSLPKQFQRLVGPLSTYQQTLKRVADPSRFGRPVVMTNAELRFFAENQASDVGAAVTVLLEPERRNSAPALAAAAAFVAASDPGALVLALAADHVILDDAAFLAAVDAAATVAAAGDIVTFGMAPTYPATGYGYIRPGAAIGETGARRVAAFAEKPDAATAARYLAEGCLWNSGNFLFRADVLLAELDRFAPGVADAARAAAAGAKTDSALGFVRLDAASFRAAPVISIDYAVMEKTERIAVVPASFGWSDVGSWEAIYDLGGTDEAGNVLDGPVEAVETAGSLIRSDGPVVGVIGLDDVVVVASADAVLVTRRSLSGEVKTLVDRLRSRNHHQVSSHARCYRPWGSYESIDRGDRFQVKRIVVEPGARLSLQKHMHRAEHWVVVRGTAEVTIDERVQVLSENQSVYVPLGAVHRLANPGRIPLELIEVQTGSYLEEDDIVRLEDVYARA